MLHNDVISSAFIRRRDVLSFAREEFFHTQENDFTTATGIEAEIAKAILHIDECSHRRNRPTAEFRINHL